MKKDDLDASRDLTGEEVPRMAIEGPPWMTATQLQGSNQPKKVQTRGSGRSVTNVKIITSGREGLYGGGGGANENKLVAQKLNITIHPNDNQTEWGNISIA